MSNLTLKHLVEYIESTRQLSRKKGENIIQASVGHGDYGIVEEPCGVDLRWMPPLTILPPRDYSMRRYYGS
jgi:hypothetical protein